MSRYCHLIYTGIDLRKLLLTLERAWYLKYIKGNQFHKLINTDFLTFNHTIYSFIIIILIVKYGIYKIIKIKIETDQQIFKYWFTRFSLIFLFKLLFDEMFGIQFVSLTCNLKDLNYF